VARAIDIVLKAEGAVIAAASASPAPPPDAEKIRRSLEHALADGMTSPALLDEWDAAVTRYGYRARDTPSPVLLADLITDLADLRLAITRDRSASALPPCPDRGAYFRPGLPYLHQDRGPASLSRVGQNSSARRQRCRRPDYPFMGDGAGSIRLLLRR
jgi:hypothetical protein